MEEATREQIRVLAYLLKKAEVDEETALNVALRLDEAPRMQKMIEWLQENDPTVNEICAKSREIERA